MQKLSWREVYAGILVLLIGCMELILQVSGMMSSKAHGFAIDSGKLIIDKSELFNDLRSYVTIIVGLLGGLLLIKQKRFGWVIGMPLLLLFTIVSGGVAVGFAIAKDYSLSFKVSAGISFLMLLAAIFLLLPSAQEKYRVSKATWLPTLVFFMAITAVYFFL
jgi:hypothetical protein